MHLKQKAFSDHISESRVFKENIVAHYDFNIQTPNLIINCIIKNHDPQSQEEFKEYFFSKIHDYFFDFPRWYPQARLPYDKVKDIFNELLQNIFEAPIEHFIKCHPQAEALTKDLPKFAEKAALIEKTFPHVSFPTRLCFETKVIEHDKHPELNIYLANPANLSKTTLAAIDKKLDMLPADILRDYEQNAIKGSAGFGLAAAKKIINAYNGHLWIDSSSLTNTCTDDDQPATDLFEIYITFPLAPRIIA